MPDNPTFFSDEEVSARIIGVVARAEKFAVLVSPYLEPWSHLTNAVKLAAARKVDVGVVVRKDDQVLSKPGIGIMVDASAKVLVLGNLHAKIYLNERQVLVSSMNLTEHSTKNSHEFALEVADSAGVAVRHYVMETIMRLAEPIGVSGRVMARAPTTLAGHCIRCGHPIPFEPSRPLCDDCYDVWAEWKNPDYVERACHRCGEGADVTYARPLCARCYRGRVP